jgi:hypothetical protein
MKGKNVLSQSPIVDKSPVLPKLANGIKFISFQIEYSILLLIKIFGKLEIDNNTVFKHLIDLPRIQTYYFNS